MMIDPIGTILGIYELIGILRSIVNTITSNKAQCLRLIERMGSLQNLLFTYFPSPTSPGSFSSIQIAQVC